MLITHRNQRLTTWIDPPNYLSYRSGGEAPLEHTTFTLGFARRFSTYKRADLIFEDLDRLAAIITENNWPVNFIYAGKAHPSDEPGKDLIRNVLAVQEELYLKSHGLAKLVFIPGYDMHLAKMMVSGSHAWLNSPKRPLEASGTSGMKAAMNGVPNLSIMDGWWVEGYHDGQTGWKFGYEESVSHEHFSEQPSSLLYSEDSASFYKIFPTRPCITSILINASPTSSSTAPSSIPTVWRRSMSPATISILLRNYSEKWKNSAAST
jgi:starch phosphorylase